MIADQATLIAHIDHIAGAGWAMTVLMWVTVIVAIGAFVWFATRGTTQLGRTDATRTALVILAERYARGNIDDDEYRRRVDLLTNGT